MTNRRPGAKREQHMLVDRWLSLCFILSSSLSLACQRKPSPQAHEWASNPGATPVITAAPLPLEEPVQTLRVPNSGLPCAVDDVLARKCRRCHTIPARHTAPFALLTWDDTHGMRGDRVRFEVMASAVKSGFMPYNIPANPPVERLTEEEKRTISDWAEAGAPRAACPPVPAASGSARPKRVPAPNSAARPLPKAPPAL
jgi:hypothetical protein